jgi:hypothetical protein
VPDSSTLVGRVVGCRVAEADELLYDAGDHHSVGPAMPSGLPMRMFNPLHCMRVMCSGVPAASPFARRRRSDSSGRPLFVGIGRMRR